MIIDKYLRTWLGFDDSSAKGKDNTGSDWNWSTAGTIVADAIHGSAVKISAADFYSRNNMDLGGSDFTIQFHCKATQNNNTEGYGILSMSINSVTKSSGKLFQLKDTPKTGEYILDYSPSGAPASAIADLVSYNTGVTAPNVWMHVAIVYQHTLKTLSLFLDGTKVKDCVFTDAVTRQGWKLQLALAHTLDKGYSRYGYCTIDEFSVHDGVALYTADFTPPTASYYTEIVADFATERTVKQKWRYQNEGRADLLTVTGGTTLTDLPLEQSVTGVAFYQPNQTACFGIPAAEEIWIRLDIYTTANYQNNDRLRIYSSDGNGVNGWNTHATITNKYMLWHNGTSKNGPNYFSKNELRSMIVHMKSGTSDGVVEYWFNNGDSDRYIGNVNKGADFANVYIQMDGSNIWVSNLIISNVELTFADGFNVALFDTERLLSKSLALPFDTERIVNKTWRYENYGTATLLTVAGNTLTNLPIEKSGIRSAFWQSGRVGCFDIPAAKELWVKWDLYYTGSAKWRVYNRENGNDTGVAQQNDATSLVCYINGPTMADVKPAGTITKAARKTYLLHMVSDATNGVIELWIDGQKYYSDNFQSQGLVYKGNVNNGDYFTGLYMQSDNNTNLFSNVIISDGQIGFNENTWEETDAERVIHTSVALNFDTVRQIVSQEISVNADFDLSRVIVTSTEAITDTERVLSYGGYLDADIERKLQNAVTVDFDTQRRLKIPVVDYPDTERVIQYSAEVTIDIQRVILESVEFNCDIWRQLPHRVNENSTFLQSVTISLQEQQLTDNVSFVMAGDINILDAVTFHAWDYILHCRAEETSKRGVLLSCKCTVDIDQLLYQQMAYKIPESKWEWTDEYLEKFDKFKLEHKDMSDVKKMPSALASTHITAIANALGLNVVLQFDDWVSTLNTEVKSGTNYAGLLSELFGWTSRLPHLMINCYIRGNTMHVVQRGHEQNTVVLDGNKLSVHTVNKKLMRMTWGSDLNSETEVVPYYYDWTEYEKTPLPEDLGNGWKLNNDGLVSEYINEYSGESTLVTCSYDVDRLGRKMLRKETAAGVVTIHEPIGLNQKKVVSYDEDGILGSAVTPSNLDDRVTPYQASSAFRGGMVVSDVQGNQYLVLRITYHQEEIDMKRRTVYGLAMIDTSFPVDGQEMLEFLTQQIMWLDRKTEESVTLDIYDYQHLIDFNDKIVWHGNTYYLRSNTAIKNENIVNKQTLEFVRWY